MDDLKTASVDASWIDGFYNVVIQAVTIGMVSLSEAVALMMIGILVIRLFYVIGGFVEGKEGMIGIAVSHTVPVMILSWVSVEWITVTKVAAQAAMGLGEIASGNQGQTIALFKVSEIILNGLRIVKSIVEYLASLITGPISFAKVFAFLPWYLIACAAIVISQFYVAYIIFRANVEYALHCLGTLAMLPFAAAGQTAWVVQSAIGGFAAHLVNLMLLSVAVNIGQPLMNGAMLEKDPSYQQAVFMAGVAVFYAGFCFMVRKMSQGFINGGPALSGGGGIGGAVMGLIKGGLVGAGFQIARNHMQGEQQKQRALNHQPQGGINSGGTAGSVGGVSGAANGASAVLGGRQWNDTPSPYAATLKTAKAGYRQAFESNVSQTPNLPNGFVDQVRADFDKVNIEAGKQGADLLRKGYWEQFGFGHSGQHSSNPQKQIKP